MQRFADRQSSVGTVLTGALKELREVAWLAAVVATLSVLGIVLAVSLAVALDYYSGGSAPKTTKTAHCPTSTHR